jgi:CHAD domain-containing protein
VGNDMSRSYGLKLEEGAGEGMRRIARGRAERALEELRKAEAGGPPESIHAARKDLKKLRAVLRMSRDELGGKLFRAENRRYRDAGRLLSDSRDAEVKLQTVGSLRRHSGSAFPSRAGADWEGALERERDARVGNAKSQRDPIERAMRMIEEGRDRIDDWPLTEDSWKLVGPGLVRSYRTGRQGMKRVLADPTPAGVHEWRKRAKDLWYQLRIVRNAWPEVLGATVEQLHELTELHGDHHDLTVLADDLARRQIEQRGTFEQLIAGRQSELLDHALQIGRRVYAEKPKAFSRRIESYWDDWRRS